MSKFTATVYDNDGNELAYVRTPETAVAILNAIPGSFCRWRTYLLWGADDKGKAKAEIIEKRWSEAQDSVEAKKQARLAPKPPRTRKKTETANV
jgi:hypothetical protein